MHSTTLPPNTLSPVDALCVLVETIERVDPRLKGHGIRTARYAVHLGHAIGMPEAELTHLCLASLLHDIGLLTVLQSLLRKDGPLTDVEYALVQSHPRAGAELLEPIPFLRVPALWIAHHHERWDGCGYPYGLRGELIPMGSRILAVADTFDSLMSPHWSGHRRDVESALCLLRLLAGSQLDPDLVEVFAQRVPECVGQDNIPATAAEFGNGGDQERLVPPLRRAGCAVPPPPARSL